VAWKEEKRGREEEKDQEVEGGSIRGFLVLLTDRRVEREQRQKRVCEERRKREEKEIEKRRRGHQRKMNELKNE